MGGFASFWPRKDAQLRECYRGATRAADDSKSDVRGDSPLQGRRVCRSELAITLPAQQNL